MHICLISQWFPPENGWGGIGAYNRHLADGLRSIEHEVSVISSLVKGAPEEKVEPGGVHVYRIPMPSILDRAHRLPLEGGGLVRPLRDLLYAWRVKRKLDELIAIQGIDIVEYAEINCEGIFHSQGNRKPFIVRCHTPYFLLHRFCKPEGKGIGLPWMERLEVFFFYFWIKRLEKYFIRHATRVTAPSQDLANIVAAECRLPPEMVRAVPNGINIHEFFPSTRCRDDGEMHILCVARLDRAKGIFILAEAIPEVVRACPQARFIFIGPDRNRVDGLSNRIHLERRLEEEGVLSRVEIRGSVPQAKLLQAYQECDIFVNPSILYESFSYTCVQAMACGKPVVASAIGGIPEVVPDGECGYLIQPGNSEQLAELLITLIRNPEQRCAMGMKGRHRVETLYTYDVVARQMVSIYQEAQDKHYTRCIFR